MAECLYLPPSLRNPSGFLEIISRLDTALEGYQDTHTSLPITIYQFLSAWTKFSPSGYYTYYFEELADTNVWTLQEDLMHNVQLSVSTLELVIKDMISQVGGERRCYTVDAESQHQLRLKGSSSLEEIKITNKMLKL